MLQDFYMCTILWVDLWTINLYICRQHYGDQHPIYADSLVDYGFYLLNVDSVNSAVKIYQVCATLIVEKLIPIDSEITHAFAYANSFFEAIFM